MMRKRVRKLTAVCMVFAMALLMAGCGPEQKAGKKAAPADGVEEISLFYASAQPLDAEADQPWYDEIEKRYGLRINAEVPPQSNSSERLQLIMAGGDYPDVIRFMDIRDKSYLDGVKNGVIIPVTEYLKNAENIQRYTYDESWDSLTIDGQQYSIPVTSVVRNDGYAVRLDWLEKVGLTLPEDGIVSLDEFTEIIRRFTFNDPDGNGQNDTYGLGRYGAGDGTMGLAVPCPYGTFGWLKQTDESYPYMDKTYSKTDDLYKRSLQYSQDIFKEGLVDPNSPLLKRTQAEERFMQGITGVLSYFPGHIPAMAKKIEGTHPEAKIGYIVGIKDASGKVVNNVANSTLYGMWCITKTAKNPQKIVDFFDALLSEEGWPLNVYGVEGVHYTVENGKMTPTELFDRNTHKGMMRRKENIDLWANQLTMDEEWLATASKWLGSAIETVTISEDRGFVPDAASRGSFIDAKKKMSTTVTKIVMGEEPVDAYDKVLADWYQAGGEDYIKEMNAYIQSIAD